MINLRIINEQEFLDTLDKVESTATQYMRQILRVAMRALQTHIRTKYLRGQTGPNSLRRRTGTLAARTIPIPITTPEKDVLRTGISFGTRYAASHIGPRGSQQVIHAKDKLLTIPFPGSPVAKAKNPKSARSGAYKDVFVHKSKAGNLILMGRMAQHKKKIQPLFILKKRVVIKRRIHPEDLMNWLEPRIYRALQEIPL